MSPYNGGLQTGSGSHLLHIRDGAINRRCFSRNGRRHSKTAKPLNATEWRKELRSAHVARIARSNMEVTANKFLESLKSLI